jgi:hypothetical protein
MFAAAGRGHGCKGVVALKVVRRTELGFLGHVARSVRVLGDGIRC